jgi:type II secretory pathway pseudopilin PulG
MSPSAHIHVKRPVPGPSERGFTLIELLVYMSLMVVVLGLVGGMLVSSSLAQTSVRTAVQTANDAQIVSRSIANGIRNASAFKVSAPSPETELLVARIAGGETAISWSCQAWYFDGSQMYTTRRSPASAIVAPTAESLSAWSALGDTLSPAGSGKIFTASGFSVLLAFSVGTNDNDSPVIIETSTTRPAISPEVSAPCF